MRRRLTHILHVSVSLLILALILSSLHLPIAVSQNSEKIISKLRELKEDVTELPLNEAFENIHAAKGQRKALTNKIEAVIHQVKAGAYKGALNKLENDIKNTITAWVAEDYEEDLINQIDEIIRLIKGEIPPSLPHFSIEASPESLTIVQGESGSSIITVESKNGFSDPVDLEIINVPADVTVTLNPEEVTPPPDGEAVSTLMVQVGDLAIPGMYTLTVTGTSDNLVDTVDIELEIIPVPPLPDFSVAVHPSSLSIQQGTSDTATIRIRSLNGFSDLVTLTVSPVIEGLTYSLNPSSVTPPADGTITSELTLTVAETAAPDTYLLTLTGTSGTLQHSTSLSLEITTAPLPPDTEPPTVRIDEPANRSYLAGLVNIVVFMFDENFKRAELTINNTLIALWTPQNVSTKEQTIYWDTTQPEYPDGLYNVTLSAEDEAENTNKKTLLVTVDNTKPTVTIDAPAEGSYLRSLVLIRVTGEDKNFYKMNLKIDNLSKKIWTTSGSQIYEWNTKHYLDGPHNITLTVEDKAGNSEETFITTFVDNTLPTIEEPTWKPEEPFINTQVNITVKVSDAQPGSGIQNVTVWYRNTTMDYWQPIPMSLNTTSGNWTATIPAQSSETKIKFSIEALDKAGNKAVSDEIYEYPVITPAGVPLAWIIAIILLILAATAAAIYLWRKRRREEESVSSSRVKNYKLTVLLCF